MTTFVYKARTASQAIVEGLVTADNQQHAVQKIKQMGHTPFMVEVSKVQGSASVEAMSVVVSTAPKVSTQALAFFTRSLADLIEAGVPLVQSMEMLSKQRIAPALKVAVLHLGRAIKDGTSLSRALEGHPHIFNKLYVNMVKSSEAAGNLSRSLQLLSQNLEKELMIQNRVRQALLYPCIILAVGILAIVVLLTFVLPKLAAMFEDFGADLPWPTRVVVSLSDFLTHYGWILGMIIVGGVFYILKFQRTTKGHLYFSQLSLRIPLISDFIKAVQIARYTRTVAVLLESGVPITAALESGSMVLTNAVFTEQAKNIAQQVRMGTSLSAAVRSAAVFGDICANLIAVGEQGGRLEGNLFKIAAIHEDQSQHMTENALSALGPAVLIFVVVIVGGMMFAIILPLIKMNMIIQ